MKNSHPTSSGSGRSFFSSWTAPQNPIITLLKRRRESKTSSITEKQTGVSFKTSTETRQQQKPQQQQQNVHHPVVQTSFKITSSSSSTTSTPRKSNGTSLQNANEIMLKRNTNGFQPMKIEEYEPGHSSIALKEGIMEPADYNPPICKPGELCRYSESKESKNFRIRKKTETSNGSRLGFFGIPKITSRQTQAGNDSDRLGDGGDGNDADGGKVLMREKVGQKEDAHAVYRSVQKGGLIPEEGLRNLIDTRMVKTLPAPAPMTTTGLAMKKSLTGLPNGTSADYLERIFEQEVSSRMGGKKTRVELEEEMRMRKMTMDRILAEEKLKKLEEEKRSNEARRHNDNFLPVEKSPVKLNRYDDDTVEGRSRNNPRKSKFTAVAVYNFKAKNDRELTLRKGDVVKVLKQIDKNWFEGDLNGRVGMFPITYVKINLPQSQTRKEPTLRGKVLYDFNASAPPELSLYRGERVTVVAAIDDNWVEGRSRNGEGIFPLSYVKILDDDDDDDDNMGGASRSSSQYGTPLHSRTVTPSFDHRNAYSRLSLRERPKADLRVSSPVGSTVSSYAPTIPSAPLSPFGSQELDTTMRSFGASDWPSLEASLLDLEKVSISQLMRQQQQQQKPVAGRFGAEKTLERAASLQYKYRPQQHDSFLQQQQQQQQQQQLRQQLLQLEREAEQQRKTQLRHSQLDRFQDRSRDSPRSELLSQSAHPDLCAGGSYLSRNNPASRSMIVTRSATNSGLSERSITNNYNQSSPYHRYPSLISKDAVVVDNEVVVKDMMAKQSEAVTREFLSRHASNASLARSVTPLARHSLPVAKDSANVATLQRRPVSRQPIGSSSDYFSSSTTLRGAGGAPASSGLDSEIFAFKEIKLKPRLPADYSRSCYTVETRTSLPGVRSETPTSPIGRDSPSPFSVLSRGREVSPMKSYEWHKVSHDFRPTRPDEIRLSTGDMVQVVEKCRDGWWLGISQTTGKMGLFPGSYVTPS